MERTRRHRELSTAAAAAVSRPGNWKERKDPEPKTAIRLGRLIMNLERMRRARIKWLPRHGAVNA